MLWCRHFVFSFCHPSIPLLLFLFALFLPPPPLLPCPGTDDPAVASAGAWGHAQRGEGTSVLQKPCLFACPSAFRQAIQELLLNVGQTLPSCLKYGGWAKLRFHPSWGVGFAPMQSTTRLLPNLSQGRRKEGIQPFKSVACLVTGLDCGSTCRCHQLRMVKKPTHPRPCQAFAHLRRNLLAASTPLQALPPSAESFQDWLGEEGMESPAETFQVLGP